MAEAAAPTETRKPGRIREFFSRPPGYPTTIFVTINAIVTLMAFSVLGGPDVEPFFFLGFGWLALRAYWLLRLVVAWRLVGAEKLSSPSRADSYIAAVSLLHPLMESNSGLVREALEDFDLAQVLRS